MRSFSESDMPVSELRRLLDYDPISGQFTWRRRDNVRRNWNTRYAGTRAGTTRDGAVQIRIQLGEKWGYFLAHRIAWAMHYGAWPTELIDHADGDPSSNRISNLRAASYEQNNSNRRVVNGKSKFKGVYFHAKQCRFAAQIKSNKTWRWLGLHDTEEDAARAYDVAAEELHGEFAATNFKLGLFSDV